MLISIITTTYNSEEFLESALQSYLLQDYREKEWVVIDGASKDQTLEILDRNRNYIDHLVSEPDQGIYEALNKGIALSRGEVIGILHSDDLFASADVLKKVAQQFKDNPELLAVYGDLQYIDRADPSKIIRNWISGNGSIQKLAFGWMPPHPALFIRKTCFTAMGNYNLKYNSAADYDLILRFFYKNKIKVAYIPEVLVKMRVGGLSNKTLKNRIKANQEDRQAMKENGINLPWLVAMLKPLRKVSQYWKNN